MDQKTWFRSEIEDPRDASETFSVDFTVIQGEDILSALNERLRSIQFDSRTQNYEGEWGNLNDLLQFLQNTGENLELLEDVTNWDQVRISLFPDSFIRSIYFPRTIFQVPNCEGCRWGLPGQEGHMEPGGCLYSSPDGGNESPWASSATEYDYDL